MTDTLWFGTTSKFLACPRPDLPFEASEVGFVSGFGTESGGWVQQTSQASAKRYDFTFDYGSAADVNLYKRFRQGSFGSGLLHFSHPFHFHTNLFSPAHAEPGLIEGGDWPPITDNDPSFSNVSANSYDQPLRKATWSVTQAADTAPTRQRSSTIIPIPPDQTLHVGVSGAATGTAVIHVIAHNIAAGTSAASNLTLLTDTSSTRLNASFSGASYDYVEIFWEWRTSSASSTMTVTSAMAQLWPTVTSPTLTGNHVAGEGHTGLRFFGDTFTHRYQRMLTAENLKAVAFSLVEVQAWLPE